MKKKKESYCFICNRVLVGRSDSVARHIMSNRHLNDVKIDYEGRIITLIEFKEVLDKIKNNKRVFFCPICWKYKSVNRDDVERHFASRYRDKIHFTKPQHRNKWLNIDAIRKKKATTRVIAYKGNYMEFLMSWGNLMDHIDQEFPTENKIKKKLSMTKSDFCCDGAVHYIDCKYSIIEDKASNVYHAIDQLEDVGKAIRRAGSSVKIALIMGDKLNRKSAQIYSLRGIKLIYKNNKKEVKLLKNGPNILYVKYGISSDKFWELYNEGDF